MTNKQIIRVFPRRTSATPTDELIRINTAPSLFDTADEVHISVTFTWDIPHAERLANQWKMVAPVKIGGPAFGQRSSDFTSGMYLKKGITITSRGCPNRCWFCSVPQREGNELRELPIVDGWIIQDDNLLACSPGHIDKVFEMLKRQPKRPNFTGGLEAKLLTQEMAFRLKELKPESLFFAYDTPSNYDPLIQAGRYLQNAGFGKSSHTLRCYVLIGYETDTFEKAEKRMYQAWNAGFMPFSMLFRNDDGNPDPQWKKFHRQWANPFIIATNLKTT
jgi:hypothetical protein